MNEPTIAQLRAALERSLKPRSLDIVDDSARHAGHAGARGGGHFRVTLVVGCLSRTLAARAPSPGVRRGRAPR